MDFDLTQDQQEIKTVARELLAARSPWAPWVCCWPST